MKIDWLYSNIGLHVKASSRLIGRNNKISKSYATIFLEDLKIKNMTKSAKGTKEKPDTNVKTKLGLNKSILDQGWYEFRRQLE